MKVVWGKFGTGVDLIVCAISSYWWVSLWVNEKDAFHAYSLKTSIIVFLGIMFFLSIAAYGTVTFLLKRIYIYEWGIMLSFWGYEKKIEWEDFTVIQRYNDHFFFNISKQKDDSLFWCMSAHSASRARAAPPAYGRGAAYTCKNPARDPG